MKQQLFRSNIAILGTPTLSEVTSGGMTVTGSIGWFKDGQWGYAYKKASATTWTYVPQTGKEIEASLTGLDASTKYDVCLYVKFDGAYQRGTKASATTEAAAPAETPTT